MTPPLMFVRPCRRRGTEGGQGLVEFALVAPLFFFVMLAIVNGGLFLFGRNSVEHASDVGMAAIAAEGFYDNPANPAPNDADQVGIARMRVAGLSTSLISITEIDVKRKVEAAGGGLVDDTNGCGGSPCLNRYRADGGVIQMNWRPANRQTGNGGVGGTPDFAELDVRYVYRSFGQVGAFSLTSTKIFRLEPQT